jgi:hemoglobin
MTGPASPTPYELIGGEAKLRALVERFYVLMHEEPAFAGIRQMHPGSLERSTENLFMFLSGWLGGPPLYAEKKGHPMLRARHLPFAIGQAERDQWMACMMRAMEEEGLDEGLRDALADAFFKTADWMRNRPG